MHEYGVTIDDLPTEDIKLIAEIAGLDAALKLSIQFGGDTIYFPKKETLTRSRRNSVIKKQFNGKNKQALFKKFNLTKRHIRTIIKGG